MRTFTLQREQLVPMPIEEVFGFFAEAKNLEVITPPWLGFRILTPGPIAMRAGARIDYRLRWHRLPLRWQTEIAEWAPPFRFADVQRRGPYALWHHTHEFEAQEDGTRMRDQVRYALPLGYLGQLMHSLFVGRDLEAIFDYRARRVEQICRTPPTGSTPHNEPGTCSCDQRPANPRETL